MNKQTLAEFLGSVPLEPFVMPPEDHFARDYHALHEIIRPGAVLKVKDRDALVLVGHVNDVLGVCEDCTAFEYEDIEAIGYLAE